MLQTWRRKLFGTYIVDLRIIPDDTTLFFFFKIPYILMLFGAGLPIFFLEMALGQYAGVGPIKIFGRIAPILQGLGYVSLLLKVVISLKQIYLFLSFLKKGCGLCWCAPCIFLQCCCLMESLVPGRLFQFATIARNSFGMGVLRPSLQYEMLPFNC